MKTIVRCALVCLMVTAGSRTVAGQAPSTPERRAGVAFTVSTLGLGADVAVPVAERMNIRGGFSLFNYSYDSENDGIVLDAQLQLRSVSAHLDWFPFGGGFHLSPGVMLYNGNEVNADARVPGGDAFDLGDEDLISDPANPIVGTAVFSFETKVAPSFRIGWGNIIPRGDRRWNVPLEIGIVYSRAPTAVLSLRGHACESTSGNCQNVATDPQLQADVREEQDEINDDISVFRVIPVISIGFSVSF